MVLVFSHLKKKVLKIILNHRKLNCYTLKIEEEKDFYVELTKSVCI